MAKSKPSPESEQYGKLKEDFFLTAFTFERGCHTLVDLIEGNRWKDCGDYADFQEFLDTLGIDKLKASLDDRKKIASLIKAHQPQIPNRAIGRATGLKHTTMDSVAAQLRAPQAKKPSANNKGAARNRAQSGDEAANTARRAEQVKGRQETVAARVTQVAMDAATLGKSSVLLADPPWDDEFGANTRSIENHYPTMKFEDILALPVADIAHEQAMLFLWATSSMLEMALETVKAWGFTYRTCMVWVKPSIGIGKYARQRHELLLIARRGDHPAPAPENLPGSVIEAPRSEHSEKPEVFHEIIERMYPTAERIELFRRGPARPGWKAWGNEMTEPVMELYDDRIRVPTG